MKNILHEEFHVMNRTDLLSPEYVKNMDNILRHYPYKIEVFYGGKKLVAKRHGLYPSLDGWCDASYIIQIKKRKVVVSYAEVLNFGIEQR